MCITKTIIRAGLLAALAGGVVFFVAGPERVSALFHQARSSVQHCIDKAVDDPIALRSQLRDLEGQYPKRIGEVRADLTEIEQQISQLEREGAVSKRVVELAENDLGQVKAVLARAEEARRTTAAGGAVVVRVRLGDDRAVSLDEAYTKANRINQLRGAYATRVADTETSLGYLNTQRQRLSDLLNQLEAERAQFQTQLWQLDREVDTIARNERMIEIMKKRQRTIDEQSRYRSASLDQYKAKFADIRARQEAQLQSLTTTSESQSYENAAKYQLEQDQSKSQPKGAKAQQGMFKTLEVGPSVIEIGPDDATDHGPVANR